MYSDPRHLMGPAHIESTSPDAVERYFGEMPRMGRTRKMAEEIARLKTDLDRERANLTHVQSFLNFHGGVQVWESDVVLKRQHESIEQARQREAKVLAEAEDKRSQILEGARVEAAQIIEKARQQADRTESTAGADRAAAARELENARAAGAELRAEHRELEALIPQVRESSLISATALEDFAHPAESFVALQSELRSLRSEIKRAITDDDAIEGEGVTPATPAAKRRFDKNVRRLMARSFNAESEKIVQAATAANLQPSLNKIHSVADAIDRLMAPINVRISTEYQELKARELELAVKVESARKIEKEAERERRAELKEQARIDAEMDAQRARLEKERAHYEKVLGQIRDLGDEVRAEEIQQKIVEIEVGIADVEYRQANQRAGYVYVISNLGAFGERVVKIGLTRRLDPMDRVRELGDASVPFMFDVHALFFSEDAVDVEAELHRRFADRRVNRINNRREFFYATPAEVREELVKIQGDLLEFVEVPEAEQFRASQAIIDS